MFVNQAYQRADAFLTGRRTHELCAGSWRASAERTAVREVKVHGSGTLVRWLTANDLVESRVDAKGVTIQVFRPARPRYATA